MKQFLRVCSLLVLVIHLGHSEEDSTRVILKYNYVSSPKYSTNGIDFKRTRNEFSFKSFYPDFKEVYGNKYGFEPIERAETRHLWANLVGIPGGILLGLGLSEFLFHSNDGGVKAGTILTLVSLPLISLSVKFDIDSFQSINNGIK